MKSFIPFLILCSIFFQCSKTNKSNKSSATLGLINENCSDGCTVSGLNLSKKVNCTNPTKSKAQTSLEPSSLNGTFEGVVLISSVVKGESVTLTPSVILAKVYPVSTCPLSNDNLTPSTEGKDFSKTENGSNLKIDFKRSGSYAILFSNLTNPGKITVQYTSTQVSTSTSTSTSTSSNSLKGNCLKSASPSVWMDSYSSTSCPSTDFKSLVDSVSSNKDLIAAYSQPYSTFKTQGFNFSTIGLSAFNSSAQVGSCKVTTNSDSKNIGIWNYFGGWTVGSTDSSFDPKVACTNLGGSWSTSTQTY